MPLLPLLYSLLWQNHSFNIRISHIIFSWLTGERRMKISLHIWAASLPEVIQWTDSWFCFLFYSAQSDFVTWELGRPVRILLSTTIVISLQHTRTSEHNHQRQKKELLSLQLFQKIALLIGYALILNGDSFSWHIIAYYFLCVKQMENK